jgi:protein-S-isoprenylcysteine O-methyltransferase Ste14
VTLLLPYLIARWEQGQALPQVTASAWMLPAGILVGGAGVVLFGLCVRMFIRIGRGTIMPWDPTLKLITGSLYGHVRNPMILSVIIMVAGEALIFASAGIILLGVFFFVVNTVYFILSEEPGLEKRFGEEYREYKRNVPRWVPRLKAWRD